MKKLPFIIIILNFISFYGIAQYNEGVIIEPILKTDTTSIGQKIVYPHLQHDEVTILKVTILPGKSTGWHKHSFPVFAYVLKGILTVDIENEKSMIFAENSSFSEVINTFHNGKNNEKEDLVLIAFYLGEKNRSLSIPREVDKEK